MVRHIIFLSSALVILSILTPTLANECIPRKYNHDSIVCVCNVTYCDRFESIEPSPSNVIQAFVSTRSGLRFERTEIPVLDTSDEVKGSADIEIKVNSSQRYQRILGFGAAFTDAAGISTSALPGELQDEVIRQYWSPSGLRYNLARVVIGGSDFSARKYTYNDVSFEDFDLTNFSLAQEDYQYKIPYIEKAISLSGDELMLFGSAWSSPAWMKTNNKLNGRGSLKGDPKGEYYRAWARYYIKFLEAYQKRGIKFWALTSGNEPMNGHIPFFLFNCLAFTPSTQRDFIKYHLGPALASSDFANTSIMMLDDQRYTLPFWPQRVLSDPVASQYIAGIALHWYGDKFAPISLLDTLHDRYADKFILNSEATHVGRPKLGHWHRAEGYLHSILSDLNHWVAGWVEWNFALDLRGGPNWSKNYCDAPIIVNSTSGEFYKQPMFYALAHVTRFVPRESRRVAMQLKDNSWKVPFVTRVTAAAFVTPSDDKVIVILNQHSSPKSAVINELDTGKQYRLTVPAKSFVTLYRNEKKDIHHSA